ncbi:MAG TPA: hypothetical protein VH877_23065 [Polyangia bacterium]|jgi:hypothetical protein|nr:hypothetical protein [Polyangia bacterium]
MAIAIYDKGQGQRLFEVNEEQLQSLIDALEEEDVGDRDYYIDAAVCDFLEGRVDAEVVAHLRAALPAGALGMNGGGLPEADGEDADGAEVGAAPMDGPDAQAGAASEADGGEDADQGIEIEWRRE